MKLNSMSIFFTLVAILSNYNLFGAGAGTGVAQMDISEDIPREEPGPTGAKCETEIPPQIRALNFFAYQKQQREALDLLYKKMEIQSTLQKLTKDLRAVNLRIGLLSADEWVNEEPLNKARDKRNVLLKTIEKLTNALKALGGPY